MMKIIFPIESETERLYRELMAKGLKVYINRCPWLAGFYLAEIMDTDLERFIKERGKR